MKTVYSLVALVAVSILFVSCGKKGLDYTYSEFVGSEKDKIREVITADESFALLDTLDLITEGIAAKKEQDKYKETKLGEILKEHRIKEAELAPRKKYFDVAVENLKKLLKNPESLEVPPLSLEDTDELTIMNEIGEDDTTHKKVIFVYHARGGFNNRVANVYVSYVSPDSTTGELVETLGYIPD